MQKDPETFAIIGAAMEFQERGIPFKAEVALPIHYKKKLLACPYRADFVCFESVIVETKAIATLTGADEAQLINELKATGLRRGLLLNFGSASLEHKRLVLGSSDNLRKSAKSVDEIYL